MPLLLTTLILLLTAAALEILRRYRPHFRFSWLLATAATAAAWLSVWAWLPQMPFGLTVPLWKSAISLNTFAAFDFDGVTWPYALSVGTIVLAILLTAPGRPVLPIPGSWGLSLTIAVLGLLAAGASGPLTLVLFWAGLDLVDAGAQLTRTGGRAGGTSLAFPFAMRLTSTALVLLALVLGTTPDSAGGFREIVGLGAVLLPAAAIVRLGALAFPRVTAAQVQPEDPADIIIDLTAGSSAVAFLSKTSIGDAGGALWLHALCLAAAMYAGWMWLRAPDARFGRPFWIMGIGNLAVAAALRGSTAGATAWGSAAMLAGTAVFLSLGRELQVRRIGLIGVWICSALPLSLTAVAWLGGGGFQDVFLIGFLLAQAALLAGLAYQALQPTAEQPHQTGILSLRGVQLVGVLLPLASALLLGFWSWPGAFQLGAPAAGLIALAGTAGLSVAKQRLTGLSPIASEWIPQVDSRPLSAVRREATAIQGGLRRMLTAISRTIEGEAGILWSLMILVLFVSLIIDRGR